MLWPMVAWVMWEYVTEEGTQEMGENTGQQKWKVLCPEILLILNVKTHHTCLVWTLRCPS